MKMIRTEDAVGHVLCHDVTQIIRGVTKDARFRKGHIVAAEDVPVLLSMGKDHIYIWEKDETRLHENEAAERLRRICQNEGMEPSAVKEGKIELRACQDGLFKVDVGKLDAINALDEIIIAVRHTDTPVKRGDKLAGMRVIPLVIDKGRLEAAEQIGGDQPILSLLPYRVLRAGVVTTGNEVFHGRIRDTFTPVVVDKLASYGVTVAAQRFSDDDAGHIRAAIQELLAMGLDMILCTGGMSVDPDDRTPAAIRDTGARIVTYGAPVLPGAMLMLAYYEAAERTVPVLGLPGCVMYAHTTVFDLLLPRLLAGDPIVRQDITRLGHGGLCLGCADCRYPDCSFGKS